jgi:predicted phage terminase large subunit-like protein
MNLLPPDDHEWLLQHDNDYKELWKLESYTSFWLFCLFMDYEFYYIRRSVLEPVAKAMQNLILPDSEENELDILNVSLPPRTGKSYLATLFCGWALGRFPKESIMRNTVTSALSDKFHNDLIKLFDGDVASGKYLDIFRVDTTKKSVTGIALREAKQGVSYFGAGCGGAIIGFGASILSIIDDSVKNEEEALSELQMDKKWGWYTSTVDSREEKGCKKLFIGTRWSNRDIVGRLKSHNIFKGDRTYDITVSALDENDKSYCEDIHTTESLLQKRLITDELIWEAEWQQYPIEAKGLLFPPDTLNYFDIDDLRLKEADGVILVGDTADEGDDSLCVPVGYQYGDKIYVVDVIFTKEPIEITQPIVASFIDKHTPDQILFESNNGGKGYAQKLNDLCSHRKKVQWKPTTTNKHTRIIMKSGIIKENFYFREDSKISREYRDFMQELTRYNRAGKNKHDDAPDGITMLAELTTREKWGW